MTVTATSTMSSASLNSVIESTTQLNHLQESEMAAPQPDGSHVTTSVWPDSIKSTTMANQIAHNNIDQIIFHFGWIDYSLFAALLGISTLIGVFYGFFSKHKQNNISEYIFGGRSMQILPVATSMIASLV